MVDSSINNDRIAMIDQDYFYPEHEAIAALCEALSLTAEQLKAIQTQTANLITRMRKHTGNNVDVADFLQEYDLSSSEGVALMCLAEALLRVPDDFTADKLIKDKLGDGDWGEHAGQSQSFFVNAATWGLMLTGKLVGGSEGHKSWQAKLTHLVERSGEPIIRRAVRQSMKVIGGQFVLGETIQDAFKNAKKYSELGQLLSYDMLGEAACTDQDALRYLASYLDSIGAIESQFSRQDLIKSPGISVKLSALHPRFEMTNKVDVLKELYPRLKQIAIRCASINIPMTIDAEEAARLNLTLQLLEKLALDPDLGNWAGLGIAVQAYQKRAVSVVDYIVELAARSKRRIMVRLVKGAYWDYEIKYAQVNGHDGYPVFTRKSATDLSYLVCAQKLLSHPDEIYPMFATHNAFSVIAVMAMAGSKSCEFQRLHGMGDALYGVLHSAAKVAPTVRVYAPVGNYRQLLAYLVRRLLENGANSSFVRQLGNADVSSESLAIDPVTKLEKKPFDYAAIPMPDSIFSNRTNSAGVSFGSELAINNFTDEVQQFKDKKYDFCRSKRGDLAMVVRSPAHKDHVVGKYENKQIKDIDEIIERANSGFSVWQSTTVEARAQVLERFASLLCENQAELIALAARESGKTLQSGVGEIREAVDFCRYYAQQAIELFSTGVDFEGPTGEHNHSVWEPRGVILCISPWNFPLAIFVGQVVAALAAGNAVIAKPAEQSSLMALRVTDLLYDAGVPENVIQCVPGKGEEIGAALVKRESVAAVLFTGSTDVAKLVQRSLARREGPIVPLVAETGGINVMLADSSTLPEQLVHDVIASAFDSAGQRCSALRVLYVQVDIYPIVCNLLAGAVRKLRVGDPLDVATDIGPVIDQTARSQLIKHQCNMQQSKECIVAAEVDANIDNVGYFIAPQIYRLSSINELSNEVFGPILHVVTYEAEQLPQVVDEINACGFGLTFGVHSRIAKTISYLAKNIKVGNVYVNRNMIGATVGVQPFGGRGLSGTGPKAGGPNYLQRLAVEKVVTINTTAMGGNTDLLGVEDD